MREITLDVQVDDEPRLVEAARAHPADFSPLYERYFARIYRYCLRRVQDTHEAEDLTSLIFTRSLAHLASYRGASFAAWLFQIAHNAVLNHRRDQRSQIPLEQADSLPSEDNPLESLETSQTVRCIADLIAALPDDQRELLALRVEGELSAREIGAVLGKSEGAVRVALHRVIQRLRDGYAQAQQENMK